MIYLLGGSGYVGTAYQALLTRKGIAFRNLRRAEVDYTNRDVLRMSTQNTAGGHQPTHNGCLQANQGEWRIEHADL